MTERMIDTGITEGDLLAALADEYRAQQKQPGEFSATDFVTQVGGDCTPDKARKFLDTLVKQKRLTVRKTPTGNVYRAIK